MFRLVLIPLLTCSLLACPLRCIPAAAIAASDMIVASSAGCTCCTPPAAKETGSAARGLTATVPKPPVGDCGCLSCICEGAVLPSGDGPAQIMLLDLGEGLPAGASIDAREAIGDSYRHRPDRFSSRGYALGGRAARIAHRSLLI